MLYVSDLFSKFENEKIIHKTITNYYLLFMKRTFVFFATGFEEIEAVGTVDILRRGGMDVVSVSISDTLEVVGAHGLRVLADVKIADVVGEEAEWLVLPGGMPGAQSRESSGNVLRCLGRTLSGGERVARFFRRVE